MNVRFLAAGLTAAFFGMPAVAGAVAVDLTSWSGEGSSWDLFSGNTIAAQMSNSPTSVYHTQQNDLGRSYSGKMYVNTSSDNDFFGFVLGYQPGDISISSTNTNIDYLLVDWKQSDQGNGLEGMAVSRVTGNIYRSGVSSGLTTSDPWAHTGVVEEVARANTLGDTGWDDFTFYDFRVDYLPDLLHVYINNILEIELVPGDIGELAFNPGSFGFYAFSQERSKFKAVTVEDIAPPAPVPLPAGLVLGLGGIGALAALRRKKARSAA